MLNITELFKPEYFWEGFFTTTSLILKTCWNYILEHPQAAVLLIVLAAVGSVAKAVRKIKTSFR
jgi:hypothetical protein